MSRRLASLFAGLCALTVFTFEHGKLIAAPPRSATTTALASVRIDGVPFILQKPDFCGEACAAMYLRKLGYAYDQDAVFNQSGLDSLQARGCYTRELNAALMRIGFKTGDVWYRISPVDAPRQLNAQWQALYADLKAGIPSIICTRFDETPQATEHFRLILGYDADRDEVIFHDPAVARGAYQRMERAKALDIWPLKYSRQTWTVVRMRLAQDQIVRPAATTGRGDADYAQHMMRLRKKIPSEDFHVMIERPFVVIGDDTEPEVKRRAEGTVRWAVQLLKKDYFTRDPQDIIDIWLFKDKESYEENVKAIFGDEPTTPFGYYSPTDKALIMNISTGGGTLVHEIVHPFVASNFPRCPSWFNEGLASLYEHANERDDHIIGGVNWRLPGLQRAIRGKTCPTFANLCATTTREFYEDPRGVHYGQARYLCYYLQEQGKLREFYHRFRRAAPEDPTGYKTLTTVLGEKDMAAFQKRWEKYVLALKYE